MMMMWLRRRLRQLTALRRLPPDERAGLLSAWALLIMVDALCQSIGARRCLRGLRWMAAVSGRALAPSDWALRQAEFVSRAARHTPRPTTCLIRAIALWFLLTRRGIACEVKIGVQKTPDALRAHAWVEWQGRPLLEAADIGRQYAAFERPLSAMSL